MKKAKERKRMSLALVRYSRLNVSSGCVDPLETFRRIDGMCGSNREVALDLLAVRDLIMILKLQNDLLTLNVLNEIYFEPFARKTQRLLDRNEMSYRILRFACENHIDERTVYRKLQKARTIWCKVRACK